MGEASSFTGRGSILIVDDDQSSILILSHILGAEYEIYSTVDGWEAVSLAEKHMPGVILLDISMPKANGYAVIAALKGSAKARDIPVIFTTGKSDADDEEKGLILGAADYITKPYSPISVKFRVQNQMRMLGQLRACEYEVMKYKLLNDALEAALWEMEIMADDPAAPNNKTVWSQAFRHTLGFFDERDFTDELQSWISRLHPEDKKRALDALSAHISDRTGETPYDIEYRLMLKNGDYRRFRAIASTLRDHKGTPIKVAGVILAL
ncbi:MAG: response regulator [Oscillospiraceae bacterium]|nr:response regulator [Oscillospiraceae bacterium]